MTDDRNSYASLDGEELSQGVDAKGGHTRCLQPRVLCGRLDALLGRSPLITLVLAFGFLFWGIYGGAHLMLHDAFIRPCPPGYGGYPGCFSPEEFMGLIFFLICTPIGVLLYGAVFHRAAKAVSSSVTIILMGVSVAATSTVAAVVMDNWVRPDATFPPITPLLDTLARFNGVVVFIFCALLSLAGFTVFVSAVFFRRMSSAAAVPETVSQSPHSSCWNVLVDLAKVFGLVAFFGTLFIAVGFLPTIWNASVAGHLAEQSDEATVNWVISEGDNPIIFKIYPDVLVYYCFLLGIIFIGALSHFTPLGKVFHYRFRSLIPKSLSALNFYPLGYTLGELLLMFAVLGLYIFWFYYWRFTYKRLQNSPIADADPHHLLQTYARVMGHMINLSISFLALPCTRNSLFESVFGVPFERAIKYHRFMGGVVYLFLCLHMFLWYLNWALNGYLWQNVVTTTQVQIGEGPFAHHYDNFTVLLAETAWLGLTIMLIIAVWARRNHYELFHFSHHFAIVFLLVALIHAWGNWYYTAGGLFLWIFDRFLRLVRGSTTHADLVSAEHADGVTRLVFTAPRVKYYAGQYMYVNVPSISALQWHPFSISSAPSSSTLSFHIKDMGAHTFTHALGDAVNKGTVALRRLDAHDAASPLLSSSPSASHLPVILDGPYGRPPYVEGRSALLLVAGGIGCTPVLALFQELYLRACQDVSNDAVMLTPLWPNLRKVHLVFTAASDSVLLMYSNFFHILSQKNPANLFSFSLHSTNAHKHVFSTFSDMNADSLAFTQSRIQAGRPDLAHFFAEVNKDAHRDSYSSKPIALVCGPTGLIQTVSDLAFEQDFDFHSETFEL